MDASWTEADEGLLYAVQLVEHIQRYNSFPPNNVNSPLPTQPGEKIIGVTFAQGYNLIWGKVRPESWSRFRITVKWAKDPLMAPFLWLLVLPFNIVFALIGRERATQTYSNWRPAGSGPLVITDRGLLHGVPTGLLRAPWGRVKNVTLDRQTPGVKIVYEGQEFLFTTSYKWCPWLYVACRFLAFNDRAPKLEIPAGFEERARHHRQYPE